MKKSRIVRIKKVPVNINILHYYYTTTIPHYYYTTLNYYKFPENLKNVYFKNTATNSKLDLKLQNWS